VSGIISPYALNPNIPGGLSPGAVGSGNPIASVAPLLINNLVTLTAQTFVAFLCTAGSSVRLSTLGTYLRTAGVTPGAGVNQMGIYSAAGVLLGQTADMTAAMQAAGLCEGALTAPVTIAAGTNYYLAILPNFTGTAIQTLGYNGQALNSPAAPLFGGVLPNLFATAQAALPASFTPSGLSVGGSVNFAYGR
jgi:hypothetical protein